MKRLALLLIAVTQLNFTPVAQAQDQHPTYTLRASIDNDFLNDLGRGTDQAYSNGARLDVFYTKAHKSRFFLDRWQPRAGDSSINIYNVAFNHIIYTQSDITKDYYQQHDYAWSGAMYLTHGVYSYNAQKKYDFQTEILAGVMGPASLDKPFQRTFHYMIHDHAPMGWDNQFHNDVLLNVNFTAEKQILQIDKYVMLMGSAQVQAGTMTDAIDLGPVLQVGKMAPYFTGYNAQHTTTHHKVQAYAWIKPGVQLVAWNSMLEGGMFSKMPMVRMYDGTQDTRGDIYQRIARPDIEHVVTYVAYGVVLAYQQFSLSYTQTHNSELVKDTYEHTYGNLTATFNW